MTQTKEISAETLYAIEAELQRLEDTYGRKPLKTVIDAWASIQDPDPLQCRECDATYGVDDTDGTVSSVADLRFAAEEIGWTFGGGGDYCPEHSWEEHDG